MPKTHAPVCAAPWPKESDLSKQAIESRDLSLLKPHPSQAGLFPDLPDHELQSLAESIRERGLDHPIEILPNGLIVCGHQRWRACRLLGWSTVPVIVRHDLAAVGDEAVEQRLISDNLDRRQLDPLDVARCYVRLKQLQSGRGSKKQGQRGDMRDILAKRFGLSGRTLDRYTAVLSAPLVIQRAVSAGAISLQLGEKISRLPKTSQKKIAAEIEKGAAPKKAAARYLSPPRARVSGDATIRTLLQTLDRLRREFSHQNCHASIDDAVEAHLPALRAVHELLGKVITGASRTTAESQNCCQSPEA